MNKRIAMKILRGDFPYPKRKVERARAKIHRMYAKRARRDFAELEAEFASQQKDLPQDFGKHIREHFWELVPYSDTELNNS